jgi:regulator of RNase E activity RraA
MGTAEIIEKYKRMDTTSISDALDRLGIKGGCLGIVPMVAGVKIAGPAFTVRYRPCGTEKGTIGDFMDDAAPGQVFVLDNGGRPFTIWGDIMTVYAQKLGIAGTVIDGNCRDIPRILDEKYPIFTRGRFMVTGKDRVEVDGINIPVSISDVKVRPNDIVVGDDTGIVIVPMDRAEEVLAAAREIEAKEQEIFDLLDKGMTLREARVKMGYHSLQSRR